MRRIIFILLVGVFIGMAAHVFIEMILPNATDVAHQVLPK